MELKKLIFIFGNNLGAENCRVARFQGYKAAVLQGCRSAGLQGYKAAVLQGCRII
jgi:hypothetical protein